MSSATTEATRKSQSRSKANKEKRQGQSKGGGGTERLKTVVRRLPPNLPEHIFWQSVQAWVTDDTALWKEFYPGKVKKKLNRENVHSRAYIAFKTEELVAKFSREYDGHVFKDKAGNESLAVVEFAPYQKLPLDKKKVDGRNATIDQDEEYIAFLQSLEAPSTKPHDADQLLEMLVASTERPAMPASTPLLDALKAEKSAQRDKEAIQRNHSHYKDAAQASKRDETKKKTTAAGASGSAPASKQGGESIAPLGKRAAKRAAAAQKAAAQAGPAAQPKAGNVPAAPPTAKPSPSSPNKGRSGRAGKQQASAQAPTAAPKSSSPAPGQVTPAAPSSPPAETAGSAAPALTPASSEGSTRRPRPVLGIASRQFEVALSGAGVSKAGGRRERGGEKEQEKEKEREPVKEGGPPRDRERRDGGGRRRKEDDGRSRGGPVPAPQPGVLPAPTILQREAKSPPRASQRQIQSSDATSGAVASSDTVASTPTTRGSGRRGRGRGRGGNRGAPPPVDS
ncbi:Smg-4/UPF3 family-domain-containing protein [Russula brevipes]|nr:Smg-4/UPF3 family-domain-containing protein [Russula brevipes]